jgi:parvulin-like peptidyl-prolyl isomerase
MTRAHAAFASLLLLLGGCPEKPPPPKPDVAPVKVKPTKPAVDPAIADIPLDDSVPDNRERWPRQPATPPSQVAIRTILIPYKGAKNAPDARRSKAEAERRAQRLAKAARKKGADFEALARRFSEAPVAERTEVKVVSPGDLPKPLERASFGMGVDQVSDAVATKQGYIVAMRVQPEEYSSAHILIQYKGAKLAPVAITRTKAEAKTLAEKVRVQAAKPDAQFAVLAARNSDSPSRIGGGVLRPMAPGLMPADYNNYIDAVRKLKVGEVSPVVETPFGFHIIKRLKMERIRVSHLLISFKGAEGDAKEDRNRQQAEQLIRKLQKQASAPGGGADFAELARKSSDDADTASKGGDLGLRARGMMPARFEQIAFSLKVGQVSDVVETPFGFHIILRTE